MTSTKPKTDYKGMIPYYIYNDTIPTDEDIDCWVPPGELTCAHDHESITFLTQEEYIEHARTVHPYTCLAPQCKGNEPYRTDDGKSTIVLHSHAMHRRGHKPHPRPSCYFDYCKETFSRNSNRVSHLWQFHRGEIVAAWRSTPGGEEMAVLVENYKDEKKDEKKRKIDTASASYAEDTVLSDDDETMHGTVGALNKKQKQNVLDPFLTNDNTVWANSVSTAAVESFKTPPPVAEQQRAVFGGVSTTIQSTEVYTGHPDLHPDCLLNHPEFQQQVQEVLRLKKKMRDLQTSIANRKIRIEQREKRIVDIKAEIARACVEIMMPVVLQKK